jgi:hypothetical protein
MAQEKQDQTQLDMTGTARGARHPDPHAEPEARDASPEAAEVVPQISEEERRAALPEAAQRALAEADARREREKRDALPLELGGRNGPEPVRFGDWEKKGIAIDF